MDGLWLRYWPYQTRLPADDREVPDEPYNLDGAGGIPGLIDESN